MGWVLDSSTMHTLMMIPICAVLHPRYYAQMPLEGTVWWAGRLARPKQGRGKYQAFQEKHILVSLCSFLDLSTDGQRGWIRGGWTSLSWPRPDASNEGLGPSNCWSRSRFNAQTFVAQALQHMPERIRIQPEAGKCCMKKKDLWCSAIPSCGLDLLLWVYLSCYDNIWCATLILNLGMTQLVQRCMVNASLFVFDCGDPEFLEWPLFSLLLIGI